MTDVLTTCCSSYLWTLSDLYHISWWKLCLLTWLVNYATMLLVICLLTLMLLPMKTECDWWYNSLWRWLPMLKCESLSTTVLFRTTCTLTRMIIFPLLLLSLKSYTLLDYRLPGRGPLQKAYVTLDFISKFLLSFHKVTVGSWMEESPGLTGNILHVISHKAHCSLLDIIL